MTKTIIERLETWKGGRSNGYYEPFKDEIHVLKGVDIESRILLHERIHASRKDKITFKMASLLQIPAISNFLLGLLVLFSVFAVVPVLLDPSITVFYNAVPLFVIAGFFMYLNVCLTYEEEVANKAVMTSLRWLQHSSNQPKKESELIVEL